MDAEKQSNRGSALLFSLVLLTFLSLLCTVALTGGLLYQKLARRGSMAEESFSVLDQSLEEVRAGMEVLVEEEWKKGYGEILGQMYRNDMENNDEANEELREIVYGNLRELLLEEGTKALIPELAWTSSEPEEDETGDLVIRDFCLRGKAEQGGVCALVAADIRIHLPGVTFFREASGSAAENAGTEKGLVTLEHWRRTRLRREAEHAEREKLEQESLEKKIAE